MNKPLPLGIKQLFSSSILVFCLFLITTFISAWTGAPSGASCTEPPCPPGNNVATPINVGPTGQVKAGGLVLNASGGATNGLIVHAGKVGIGKDDPQHALDILGNIWLTGQIAIKDGTQGANKVLTSDANGIASWKTSAGAGTITGGSCPVGQVQTGMNTNGTPQCGSYTAPVPPGSLCGRRTYYLDIKGGQSQYDYIDLTAPMYSSNVPCQGNMLTVQFGSYPWDIVGVNGCPAGYTGIRNVTGEIGDMYSSPYKVVYILSCVKN